MRPKKRGKGVFELLGRLLSQPIFFDRRLLVDMACECGLRENDVSRRRKVLCFVDFRL